jgi:lipopolysaccharide biosynthesis glycosyltransferase
MSNRVIITATDDNYILPLLVMLYSAKISTSQDFYVVIGYIEEDLSKVNREVIFSVLNVLNIDFEFRSVQLDDVPTSSHYITRTSWIRLSLMDAIAGVVLWLDADLICLPGWDKLLDFSIISEKKSLAAGVIDPLVTHPNWQRNSTNRAVIEMGNDYINTGVLQINCDLWNELEMPTMWREAAADYYDLGFQVVDQCVLNYLFKNSYALLPSMFNFLASVPQKESLKEVCVMHFAGPTKPWHYPVFSLRSFVSPLKSKDVAVYRRIQSELIQEVEKFDDNNSLILSKVSIEMTKGRGVLSLIKHRIFSRPFLYPYLRKLSWLRKLLSRLFLKTFKSSKMFRDKI